MKAKHARPKNNSFPKDSEIFEIQPIILGGSPTDPDNKVVLTRKQHIKAVNHWNRIIWELRQQKASNNMHVPPPKSETP